MDFKKLKIFSKNETKRLWKPFLFIFLISLIIFNWSTISWIFNYKAVSILISNFFDNKNQKVLSEKVVKDEPKTKIREFEYSEKENSLEIPKIEIDVPVFLIESHKEKKILKALDRGVVLFSDFSLPGEPGQTIIIGHSAMHNWPKTNYAWAFTYLKDIAEGDTVILYFNHRKYPYYVTKKFILKEGEEIPNQNLTNSENMLMLVTCWPPGRLSMKERLAVEARLIK